MISLNVVTADWAIDGIWKVAPAGLSWIVEGSRLQIGDGCALGNECKLGDWCTLGDSWNEWREAPLGNECALGDWCTLGDGCALGNECSDFVDLGWADGYRKCIAQVKGVAYIGAGCRWFTLADALRHWGGKPDRELTMCLMQSAVAIAGLRGWSFE